MTGWGHRGGTGAIIRNESGLEIFSKKLLSVKCGANANLKHQVHIREGSLMDRQKANRILAGYLLVLAAFGLFKFAVRGVGSPEEVDFFDLVFVGWFFLGMPACAYVQFTHEVNGKIQAVLVGWKAWLVGVFKTRTHWPLIYLFAAIVFWYIDLPATVRFKVTLISLLPIEESTYNDWVNSLCVGAHGADSEECYYNAPR